jgi:uncharacterized integral membrane protein
MTAIHRPPPAPAPEAPPADAASSREPRGERFARHFRRARLYTWAILFVAVLIVLVVLIAANLRSVKLDWVFGSGHASLVWIVLASTVLGWMLGIATSVLFRFRTRVRS